MTRNLLFFLALASLISGCASPPRQELEAARAAVARAYATGASDLAPTEYQAASSALSDGERLSHEGNYRMAREILPFAEAHALRAILKAREEQSIRELQNIREQQQREEASQLERKRLPTPSTKKAITTLPPPKSKPAPEPPPQPLTRYVVNDGEALWSIAARRDIYFDALLWPLLYRANRDQIKDPRQIYPGQILSIPRDLSNREMEEAREKARQSDVFPLEVILRNSPKTPR